MKIIVSIAIIFIGSFAWQAQDELTWEMMADIKYEQKLHPELEVELDYPIFSSQMLKLRGEEVIVKGFLSRTFEEDVVLTKISELSFHHGHNTPESHEVVQVFLKEPVIYTTDKITLKGCLVLNTEDLDKLIYILEDAVVME